MKSFAEIKFDSLKEALHKSLILEEVLSNEELRLLPVGFWITRENELLENIVSTRNANAYAFFQQDQTDLTQTVKYLLNGAISDPYRVLFIVQSQNSEYLGQVGFKGLQSNEIELDAVLKSEYSSFSMYRVIKYLLNWVKTNYGITKVTLEVKLDNPRAIRLYERLGFIANHNALFTREGQGMVMVMDLS